jgi:hypothetical protein
MSKPSVMPPKTFGAIISGLVDLDEKQFNSLHSVTSGAASFSLRKSELDTLKKTIPPSVADLEFLLAALTFLYSRVSELGPADESFGPLIQNLVEEVAAEVGDSLDKSKLTDRLTLLLQSNANYQSFAKIRRLTAGFLPNGISFSSFLDLRPSFTEEDEPKIVGYVPMIQFRIRTDSSTPGLKNFVFQLDREGLVEIGKAVERAEAKLKSIDASIDLGPRLPEIR